MLRVVAIALLSAGAAMAQEVSFEEAPGKLFIRVDGKPFATYVYEDARIPRPYFCDVFAPNGVKVTRNNPPVEGQDLTDHDTYHPGLWLAFGDINGADFWRNKARVRPMRFTNRPVVENGRGTWTVKNAYESGDTAVCVEECRYTVVPRGEAVFLLWDSEFRSAKGEAVFGDQEEMGLGVRMSTPLIVQKGGAILNSEGAQNESGVWGKQAAWCDYSGTADGQRAGILLAPHPLCGVEDGASLSPVWFHARDYGLLVANAFGRNAFTGGEKSRIVLPEGKVLRLSYGIVVHGPALQRPEDLQAACDTYLKLREEASAGVSAPQERLLYDKLHLDEPRVKPQ